MSARLIDEGIVSVGDTFKILQAAGWTQRLWSALRKKGHAKKAKELLEAEFFGKEKKEKTRPPRPHLVHGLFVSTKDQVANIQEWNAKRSWGFVEADFTNLPPAPAWPADRLTAVVLVPYLETVQRTLDELWQITGARQKNRWRWEKLLSDVEHLTLLDGVEHKPGLRWEVIDLGANWDKKDGIAPATVRSAASSPHAGIIAAGAHFPRWVRAMDRKNVPYAWAPGYVANIPKERPWCSVVVVGFDRVNNSQVNLDAGGNGQCDPRCAVPVFVGA